jgi:hypothetical protein
VGEKEFAPMVVRYRAVCFSIRKSVGLNNRVDWRICMGKEDNGITLADELFGKALEKYIIEYLEKKTKAMDIDDKISQKSSPELYEKVQGLREESQELHKAAEKLLETCEHYFQKAFKEYEKKSFSDELSLSWGNSAYALAIINKREAFYKNAKNYFEKAVEKYEDISNKDDVVLRRLGNTYYELAALDMDNSLYETAKKSFEKAIDKYEDIANLNKDDYRNWGNALFELGRMEWRKFLIQIENKDPSYKKFIKKETYKIFESTENNNKISDEKASETLPIEEIDKMMKKADDLFKEVDKLYDKAIDKYEEYEKMEGEDREDVFRSWGDIYSHRGRKNRYEYLSLEEKKESLCKETEKNKNVIEDIEKAIESATDNFVEAIKKYDISEKIYKRYNNKKEERYLLGATHYRLYLTYYAKENQRTKEANDEWKKAEKFFKSLKSSILDILVDLDIDVVYPMINDTILFSLLDVQENKENKDAAFFENVVKQKKDVKREDKNKYKKMYIRSMYIISLLEVKNEHEKVVAHYTKKSITQRMLFDDEKFWLYATNYFNDPKCGKILLDYLFSDNKTEEKPSDYVAFAGSFSFNYDSLNQFRLYGKEGGEGTGLSLVFNKTFFKEELKQDRAAYLKEFSQEFPDCFEENSVQLLERSLRKPRKNTLFRCVYFDPKTDRVETVGQKERYLFYREEKVEANKRKEAADKNYSEYSTFINNVINDVDSELKELKNFVDEFKEGEKSIIEQLIFRLRYLVKHIAYKEEQECRIVKICKLGNEEEISISSHDKTLVSDLKMHFEYDLKVSQHVKEIYFGPKAITELEMFKVCLKHKELDGIKCEESTNPLV